MIEQTYFGYRQREFWRCIRGCAVEHRQPEYPPAHDAKNRYQIDEALCSAELGFSALQPDLRILWNSSIFQRSAYH